MEVLMKNRRRLHGVELHERLSELGKTANQEDDCCRRALRGALEHARNAGDALIEAKWRLGRRKKWTQWRRREFRGSPRTARVYMQIARHWDDPRIELARTRGPDIESIQGFLDVLRGKHPKPNPHDDQMDMLRDSVRKEFAVKLRGLQLEELILLDGNFEGFWTQLYVKLRDSVCAATESDYYGEDEELDRAFRERMKRWSDEVAPSRGRAP